MLLYLAVAYYLILIFPVGLVTYSLANTFRSHTEGSFPRLRVWSYRVEKWWAVIAAAWPITVWPLGLLTIGCIAVMVVDSYREQSK